MIKEKQNLDRKKVSELNVKELREQFERAFQDTFNPRLERKMAEEEEDCSPITSKNKEMKTNINLKRLDYILNILWILQPVKTVGNNRVDRLKDIVKIVAYSEDTFKYSRDIRKEVMVKNILYQKNRKTFSRDLKELKRIELLGISTMKGKSSKVSLHEKLIEIITEIG